MSFSDKIALENFYKFAFTSKEPFLCNMFALDFISWLISWQRGLYAENNFFKKCPFLAFFLGFFVRNEICLVRSLFERRICLSDPLTHSLSAEESFFFFTQQAVVKARMNYAIQRNTALRKNLPETLTAKFSPS